MLKIVNIFNLPTNIKFVTGGTVLQRLFYDARSKTDTIFAPSTTIHPVKGSPIAVVRISGRLTETVIKEFTRLTPLRCEQQRKLENKGLLPRTASLSKIYTPSDQELIDIGMIVWFPQPGSYTGEDVCEFNLHGSKAIVSKMLDTLGAIPGLRPAEPGEFSFRAVANGKMTLTQAESLPDLIASQTDNQRRMALKGLEGSTRLKYEFWSETLTNILAHLEASIDFGEDELLGEEQVVGECIRKIQHLAQEISDFIQTATRIRDVIQSGIRVVILGKPNAGKSTFMNLLCNKQKSIVSDLSGTTRDVVEHSLEMGGHSLCLMDTAGLKKFTQPASCTKEEGRSKDTLLERHDMIEREGMMKALKVASDADIILYLVDGSKLNLSNKQGFVDIQQEIEDIRNQLERHQQAGVDRRAPNIHVVINKLDLNEKLSKPAFTFKQSMEQSGIDFSLISCRTQENFSTFVDQLIGQCNRLACVDQFCASATPNSLKLEHVNERHLSLLKATERHLKLAGRLNLETIDTMSQHVRESVDYLSRIVGTVSNEQVLDVIFRDFCIGK